MSEPTIDGDEKRRELDCDSLEAEFLAIHGPPEKPFPSDLPATQRANALRTAWHSLSGGQSALCLSGGGIRSATFGLGVLQGLAQAKLLDSFHYLSTVSGGGYIGSWLTAWRRRAGDAQVLKSLADSVGERGTSLEPEPIRRLRAYSNYLSPAVGLSGDVFALIGTFLRNLFLHWLAVIPMLAAALTAPRLYLAALRYRSSELVVAIGLVVVLGCILLAFAFVTADLPGKRLDQPRRDHFKRCCLLPLAASALLLALLGAWTARPTFASQFFRSMPEAMPPWPTFLWIGGAIGAVVHTLGVLIGLRWRNYRQPGSMAGPLTAIRAAIGGGLLGGALLGMAYFMVLTQRWSALIWAWQGWYAVLAAPILFGMLWVCVTVYAGIVSHWRSDEDREWWARAGGYWLIASIAWILLGLVVIHLPVWLLSISALQSAPGSATFGAAALLGLISSAWGFWSQHGSALTNKAKTLSERLGARLLDLLALAFVVLLCVIVALLTSQVLQRLNTDGLAPAMRGLVSVEDHLFRNELSCAAGCARCEATNCKKPEPELPMARQLSAEHLAVVHDGDPRTLIASFVVLVLVGCGMWSLMGVNTFSLHSMYCSRLVRAYLGASADQGEDDAGRRRSRMPHWFTGFDRADNLPLFVPEKTGTAKLFPVFGAALNLVKAAGKRLEWQQRKAASFTFTPRCWGSTALGFQATKAYDPNHTSVQSEAAVSLGRAMAISGAAASPNMGYHTSTLVAVVMFFFNVRLGWWTSNPAPVFNLHGTDRGAFGRLRLLTAEAFGRTTDDSRYVYLSDGGHFENLGLYEMIRRRCRRIVVVDAAHDPDYAYEDLANCIRKVRIDLGISIHFDLGLPTPASCRGNRSPFAVGRIGYLEADGEPAKDGVIVYLKPVLCGDEPADVIDYAASSRRGTSLFPQQPTSDQFFDEAQFESYRILGLLAAQKAFGHGGWPAASPEHPPLRGGGADGTQTGSGAWPFQPGDGSASGPVGKGISGVGDTLRSMGDTTKMALVAAGTAAIAVTGTVSLRNTELTFSPESMRALQQQGSIRHELSAQDREAMVRHIEALRSAIGELSSRLNPRPTMPAASGLQQAVAELTSAIRSASGPDVGSPALNDQVRKLEELAKALDRRVEVLEVAAPLAADLRQASQQLANAARELRQAIERLPRPPDRPASVPVEVTLRADSALSGQLSAIKVTLDKIEELIREVPPRRNVRSTTDGGRQ